MLKFLMRIFSRRPRTLYVNLRHVNLDEHAVYDRVVEMREQWSDIYGDEIYRSRVKRRMREGLTSAQLPPLYTRIPRREFVLVKRGSEEKEA